MNTMEIKIFKTRVQNQSDIREGACFSIIEGSEDINGVDGKLLKKYREEEVNKLFNNEEEIEEFIDKFIKKYQTKIEQKENSYIITEYALFIDFNGYAGLFLSDMSDEDKQQYDEFYCWDDEYDD